MTTLRQLREELEGLASEARKPLSVRKTFDEHAHAQMDLVRAMHQRLPLLMAIVEGMEKAVELSERINDVRNEVPQSVRALNESFNAARAKVDGMMKGNT